MASATLRGLLPVPPSQLRVESTTRQRTCLRDGRQRTVLSFRRPPSRVYPLQHLLTSRNNRSSRTSFLQHSSLGSHENPSSGGVRRLVVAAAAADDEDRGTTGTDRTRRTTSGGSEAYAEESSQGIGFQGRLLRRFDPGEALRTFSVRLFLPLLLSISLLSTLVRRLLHFLTHTLQHHQKDQPPTDADGRGREVQQQHTSSRSRAVLGSLVTLAIPAAVAGISGLIAQLVETRLLSRSGAVQLAAVGVSVSVFNLVSKVLNFPLLNITTSFVAAEAEATLQQNAAPNSGEGGVSRKKVRSASPAVSAALIMGGGLGVVEAVFLVLCAAPVVQLMGVSPGSEMLAPAAEYLGLRAIGAPAVVVGLAAQGVFRGYKDTSTPLVATVGSNVVNIVLDPFLMFVCGFGVQGAAIATVIAQYAMSGYLLWKLSSSVELLPPRLSELRFDRFLQSGGLLFGRTLALLATITLATSMAARQGATSMAAHQICTQTWLAASLLADSVALAAQTMLASAFSRKDSAQVKLIATRSLQLGIAMGLVLSGLLFVSMPFLPQIFTTDSSVLEEMAVVMPYVVLLQPVTALAFVFDGLHFGASDFSYAATAMILLVLPVIPVLLFAPSVWGLGLSGVWLGLALVTTLRVAVGVFRLGSRTGPWSILDDTDTLPHQHLIPATNGAPLAAPLLLPDPGASNAQDVSRERKAQ